MLHGIADLDFRLFAALVELDEVPGELLGVLDDHEPMGQRELGQAMATDPSILVTLLNPLEADGFVARNRDPADRRRHVVTLTAAGRRHLERAAEAQREAEATEPVRRPIHSNVA